MKKKKKINMIEIDQLERKKNSKKNISTKYALCFSFLK